jgi:hypothetical protein
MNRRMRGPHVRWCGRGRGDPAALYPIDNTPGPPNKLTDVGLRHRFREQLRSTCVTHQVKDPGETGP